jgi:hypothetical protein
MTPINRVCSDALKAVQQHTGVESLTRWPRLRTCDRRIELTEP